MTPNHLSAAWSSLAPAFWKSRMAIDAIRNHRGTIDVDAAKRSCASSLLALAGSFREIPDSFFVAGCRRDLSPPLAWYSGNERCVLRCRRASQPAIFSADDVRDSSRQRLQGSDPTASCVCCSCVALRIPGRHSPVVLPLAAGFRSHPESRAFTGRTRSASPAQAGAYGRHAEDDGDVVVADFSGARCVRHNQARFAMARRNLRTPGRFAPGSHSRARTVARASSRQSGRCDPHGRGSNLLVSPIGLVVGSAARGRARTCL